MLVRVVEGGGEGHIPDGKFCLHVHDKIAVIACMNNIGSGLDLAGSRGNCAVFSNFSKLVLSADMLIEWMELFPMLILLVPSMWKRG